jgi:hypothetical protein
MPQECHDREDLLRDARALVPRVQIQATLGGRRVSLFAGFRGAALSLYYNADPVFHFNAEGELRRAFLHGRLVKAEAGQLVAMERVFTPTAVELQAQAMSGEAQAALLADLTARLAELRDVLTAGDYTLDGQVPADSDAVDRLATWLAPDRHPIVAATPRVGV